MPLFRSDDIKLEHEIGDGINAGLGPYQARLLSDAGGLTQFGAFLETLPPGSRSSHKHWHEQEDELIYMLSGTATLHEGDTTAEMHAGDTATFKAGVALGHCLENRSDQNCTYLVVGTRAPNDVVHYADKDMRLTKVNFEKIRTDKAGNVIG
jgi:uncharacterized cupin superfamily protein